MRCGGIATLRTPATLLAGPTTGLPSTQVTPRETLILPPLEIDVSSAQLGQLAEPQRAP